MYTLTDTIIAAQKAMGKALYRVVLTRTGFTTYTYTHADRVKDINHTEEEWNRSITILLDNSDNALREIDLVGYTATVGYGYNTSIGDEYYGWITTVVAQNFITRQGQSVCILTCVGLGNQLAEDKADGDYTPDKDDTRTVKDFINAIGAATLTPFDHCVAVTVDWDVEDWLVDTVAPADAFKIYDGQSRKDKLIELIGYTGCDSRIDSDNHISIFMTFARAWQADFAYVASEIVKPTLPSDWAANTAYSLNNRVKPTSQNGYWYVCSTAGTSHATTEPTWPTLDGETVTDGTVVWTCRNSNYIFTCTTAGTSDSTEPVWTYTADDTIADNSVVWTVEYDYKYDRTSTGHNLWQKSSRFRIVSPNKITVRTLPDADTPYSGSATEPVSYAKLPKEDFIYAVLASDAEAANIAAAKIDRLSRNSQTGNGLVTMNVGQEVLDWVLLTDSWGNDVARGSVKSITRHAKANTFTMSISFASRVPSVPFGTLSALMLTATPGEPVPDWAYEMLDYINALGDAHYELRQALEFILWGVVPTWHVTDELTIPVV